MAQKLLNVAILCVDCVYTETAALAMHEIGDVFAADILYHDHCCKGYFNKHYAKIEEIMNNLKKEDSLIAGDDSFKARFLAVSVYTRSTRKGRHWPSLTHPLTLARGGLL